MRKIKLSSILTASFILILLFLLTGLIGYGLHQLIPPNEYRAVIVAMLTFITYFWLSILTYRLSATLFFPIPTGNIAENTKAEFNYEAVTIIQLIIWTPWMRAQPWPVPLSGVIYRLAGAEIGDNSYSAGAILDPSFVKIGKNCLLGMQSLICPHALEGSKVRHERIEIGDNVTIGAFSIILPGCKINQGAVIGMNSVLPKGSIVGPDEIWAGVPAKLIKKKNGFV